MIVNKKDWFYKTYVYLYRIKNHQIKTSKKVDC